MAGRRQDVLTSDGSSNDVTISKRFKDKRRNDKRRYDMRRFENDVSYDEASTNDISKTSVLTMMCQLIMIQIL